MAMIKLEAAAAIASLRGGSQSPTYLASMFEADLRQSLNITALHLVASPSSFRSLLVAISNTSGTLPPRITALGSGSSKSFFSLGSLLGQRSAPRYEMLGETNLSSTSDGHPAAVLIELEFGFEGDAGTTSLSAADSPPYFSTGVPTVPGTYPATASETKGANASAKHYSNAGGTLRPLP